jgi:hypothetical protein
MLHTSFLLTVPCHGLEGCTLEYGPAWLPLFAIFVGRDARNYTQFLLFALCGAMVYTVYISINPKEKVTHPCTLPRGVGRLHIGPHS